MGNVAEVSEIHAFIFRVTVCKVGEFLCICRSVF
jgi:hypothetical protein